MQIQRDNRSQGSEASADLAAGRQVSGRMSRSTLAGRTLLVAATLLLMPGCWVVSLQPLATDDNTVAEPALTGRWEGTDSALEITAADENAYELAYTEKEKTVRFAARVVRLDGQRYLDVAPAESEERDDAIGAHLVPAHSIWRLQVSKENLQLTPIHADHLPKFLAQMQAEGQLHERSVLTLSSEALAQLLQKYGSEPGFWDEALTYARVAPGAPPERRK